MYLFYDDEGSFKYTCEAPYPIEGLIKQGKFTALYLDDNIHQDIISNYRDYTVQDGVPIYTPVPLYEKLIPLKETKIEEINLACNQDILIGFKSSCTGVEHEYKFTEEWQTNLNRQMNSLLLNNSIEFVNWTTKDLGVIIHTKEQFIKLYQDSQEFIDSKMSRYYSMKEQIMNCQSIDDIKLINW